MTATTTATAATAAVAPEVEYEKCLDCHLFVEPNDDFENDPTLAAYLHLYGECDFCTATDDSHEAKPGGGTHPLSWWREHGPALMRARFED